MEPPFLNRDAYLIKRKQKYADWVHAVDETAKDDSIEDILSRSGTIYLIDELETGMHAEAEAELENHWRTIADAEFEGWWTNEDDWPELKNIADFLEYFEWSHVEMVHDLGVYEIELE